LRLWVGEDSHLKEGTRMMLHRNAKLALAGRHALVQAIEEGMSGLQ